MAETGSIGNWMVNDFSQRIYSIELFLLSFFTENRYKILRDFQARMDMLIVDYIPLQFLDQSVFPDCNLNMFVNHQHL